jgi:tRNA nucleotidyltransferase/poly(A) polymerase
MNAQIDNLSPRAPQRPLSWPELVFDLRDLIPDPAGVYLVGGPVRDALLGRATLDLRDLDLVTGGDALALARMLGDRLDGAYYPLDPERDVGRAIFEWGGLELDLDVARLRGQGLLADLADRDFTVNAMAVSLAEPDLLIDPLGGEDDLLRHKLLRLCAPDAIARDPIRALRAVRLGLQFNLRLDKATLAAVREDGAGLVSDEGGLLQPERARDELFKMLSGPNPAGAARLLDALGLLRLAFPTLHADRVGVLEHLSHLLLTISPLRDDDTAADLIYGLAVMTLDRHRAALQEHLSVTFGDGRPLGALLALWALVEPGAAGETVRLLRLSNDERGRLAALEEGVGRFSALTGPPTPRDIYRYYRGIDETGVDAALIGLAAFLADHQPTPDAKAWGHLLDEITSPLLDGFFRRHQQYVKPPPLLTGDDLIEELGLQPGPLVGETLERLLEEQAAGEITNREEALRLARGWAEQQD